MSHECEHDWDDVCPNCDPNRKPACPHSDYMLTQKNGADGWNRVICECGVVVMSTRGPLPRPRTYEERMCDEAQSSWEKWRGL